jgi:hypothetical protein
MLKRSLPILLLLATPAIADVLPPPGVREAQLGALIRAAGHQCDERPVPTMQRPSPEQSSALLEKHLRAEIVSCANGARYRVTTSYRPGNPMSYEKDGPPPAPVVQKLD